MNTNKNIKNGNAVQKIVVAILCFLVVIGIEIGYLIWISKPIEVKDASMTSSKEITVKKIKWKKHDYNVFLNNGKPFAVDHDMNCNECFGIFD